MCILEQYETLHVWGPDNRAPLSRKKRCYRHSTMFFILCNFVLFIYGLHYNVLCIGIFFTTQKSWYTVSVCVHWKKKTMKISKNNILARNYIKSKRHTSLVWCVFSTIKYSARRSLLSWVWSYHDSGSKNVQWDRK